jgi:hypothetical protein
MKKNRVSEHSETHFLYCPVCVASHTSGSINTVCFLSKKGKGLKKISPTISAGGIFLNNCVNYQYKNITGLTGDESGKSPEITS